MSNPYLTLVAAHDALLQDASAPLFANLDQLKASTLKPAADAPVVMIFAPHPDDECIIGAAALRLQREAGFKVVNIAVTQGSNLPRQSERWTELKNACDFLGWELRETIPGGLSAVTCATRNQDAAAWAEKVAVISRLIEEYRPQVVICPNEQDGHAAHIGTHFLVLDALKNSKQACTVIQSEFWGAMAKPNTIVGTNNADTADMIAALACHVGEVQRNPYHLRLTSWMADNVRRGAEVVGGAGVAAPTFSFGTIYRVDRFDGAQLVDAGKKYLVAPEGDIRALLS